jgi:hypothetical protein
LSSRGTSPGTPYWSSGSKAPLSQPLHPCHPTYWLRLYFLTVEDARVFGDETLDWLTCRSGQRDEIEFHRWSVHEWGLLYSIRYRDLALLLDVIGLLLHFKFCRTRVWVISCHTQLT